MDLIIKLGILLFLLVLGIVLYFALMTTLLPKLLKSHCSVTMSSDRGLKKYIYPEGRGIAYEPHPQFRKYVHRYILYTENGYKYLKCKLDIGVENLRYSVVMFDRRNRVLDVIGVAEENVVSTQTQDVRLHPKTSHIALVLDSVNDEFFANEPMMRCHMWKLALFSLAVGGISFLQISTMLKLFAKCDNLWLHLGLTEGVSTFSIAFYALCIGIIAGSLAFFSIRKKGIRWVK